MIRWDTNLAIDKIEYHCYNPINPTNPIKSEVI